MELVRVTAPLVSRHLIADWANDGSDHSSVLFECGDASSVLAAASLVEELRGPLGLWLTVGPAYSAQMAARDLATLSRLIALEHVVIDAPSTPSQHLEVVRALLVDDEVTFSNDVATLRGAFNRPAPPTALGLWWHENDVLHGDGVRLSLRRRETRDAVRLTYYATT